MTSVERVITYTKLEQEHGYSIKQLPPENWPFAGQIEVENLSLVYYPGGPEVLKKLLFTVEGHEKVGVVGRTGGGKSSLVSAVFRMPEAMGQISIDDIDIGSLNLQSSRRVISVIAQDPVLFPGSLKMNLDPLGEHSEEAIWEALSKSHLTEMVKRLPEKLRHQVQESGSDFSVGERQLLCLARVLLKRSKIVILDEATASVDHTTDGLIQVRKTLIFSGFQKLSQSPESDSRRNEKCVASTQMEKEKPVGVVFPQENLLLSTVEVKPTL